MHALMFRKKPCSVSTTVNSSRELKTRRWNEYWKRDRRTQADDGSRTENTLRRSIRRRDAGNARGHAVDGFGEAAHVTHAIISVVEYDVGQVATGERFGRVTTDRTYLGPSTMPTVAVSSDQVDAADFILFGGVQPFENAGLVRIELLISAGSPVGSYPLTIVPDPQFTFLADVTGASIESTIIDGAIRIVPPGDFDEDGDVDGADFLAWQRGYGILLGAEHGDGEATGDGAVDAADLAIWDDQFGSAASPLIVDSSNAVVPESATWILLAFGGLIVFSRMRTCNRPTARPRAC
jgi:hypothetical protein